MRTAVVAILCLAGACASGKRSGDTVDAPVGEPVEDATPMPDGPPLGGFGDPCTDNQQCQSGLCILVGTSGQCTETCGTCPDGYGCLAVTGIQVEGQVTFVCVPTSNQLCTTCTQDSECTLIGMDKCVTYPDGDKACAQDCTSVACPMGYTCNDVTIGGSTYKQCMASSGACDCTAANPGAMQPCNIMTPWNVCVGAQTCGGATGWGTCEPPSQTDDPDAAYTDTNCDGIDGDMSKAIFVSAAGANTATCGLTYMDPCQTIQFGISRAQSTGRTQVYVQNGTYTGSLAMAGGISVYGGYDFNWHRAGYATTGHTVTLMGGVTAVTFTNLVSPTILDDVVVRSADAVGAGASSIGVLISGSTQVELRGVLVVPGSGAGGTDGGNGSTGASGGDGGTGTPGCENSSGLCSTCSSPAGGLSGSSSCARGGTGGSPGLGGQNGGGGGAGNGAFGCPGGPGCGGAGATCNSSRSCDGQTGFGGADGGNGGNGTGGADYGSFSGSTYIVSNGTTGSTGGNGVGGGGGGGGGGGTTLCDSYGSSGGGGGGAGCGGTFGSFGTGGGGSFGVVTLNSTVAISGASVQGGTGGVGGRGGSGGTGGTGGNGGAGGPYGGSSEQDDGGDGAAGGHGGHGGRGGDGGGGGGGPSISVVCLGTSTTNTSITGSTLTPGTGGAGGSSGAPGMTGRSAMTVGCP